MDKQQYPAHMPIQGHNHMSAGLDIQGKIAHIQQIKISSIMEHVDQIPHADNNYTAVCTTTIQAGTTTIEQFGACTPNDIGGNQHPTALLESASRLATEKALALALAVSSHDQPQIIDIPAASKHPSLRTKLKRDYSRYDNYPMTGNQKGLLLKMANETGQDIEAVSISVLSKPFASLNNKDVQDLVAHFKSR